MPSLPEASVDLIFADPPYYMRLPRRTLRRPHDQSAVASVGDADWDQFESIDDYRAFSREWLRMARRLMHKRSSLFVSGTYHNIYLLGALLQEMGFWIMNDIVWHKTNPMPNFRGARLTNAHEIILWAGRDDKARPYFDYWAMKAENGGKQMRDTWDLAICSGRERLRDASGQTAHRTQKPLHLVAKMLRMSAPPGGFVLDPFMGTATTGVAAGSAGLDWLGIERDAAMADLGAVRVAEAGLPVRVARKYAV